MLGVSSLGSFFPDFQEVLAVRSIVQRGVSLIGTAHGSDISSLLRNPDLIGLMGGVSNATVGDKPPGCQSIVNQLSINRHLTIAAQLTFYHQLLPIKRRSTNRHVNVSDQRPMNCHPTAAGHLPINSWSTADQRRLPNANQLHAGG